MSVSRRVGRTSLKRLPARSGALETSGGSVRSGSTEEISIKSIGGEAAFCRGAPSEGDTKVTSSVQKTTGPVRQAVMRRVFLSIDLL